AAQLFEPRRMRPRETTVASSFPLKRRIGEEKPVNVIRLLHGDLTRSLARHGTSSLRRRFASVIILRQSAPVKTLPSLANARSGQALVPAGKQVTFAGRPVGLALADGGKLLIVKNQRSLVFIDVATAAIKQTLPSPVGFSAVGLLVQGDVVYVSDADKHVRRA